MDTLAGVALAVLAAAGLAGQTLSIRLATRQGRSSDVLLVVMFVNLALFVPAAAVLESEPVITGRGVLAFAAAGIAGTMLGRAFFYAGIKRVGASRADPIKASMPLHATILAVVVLGEQVTALQFGGILVIIAGIALVTWEGSAADRTTGSDMPWFGLALPFAGAFFFGLEPIFASVGLGEDMSVVVGLAIKTIAAIITYVLFLRLRNELPTLVDVRTADLRWYVAAGFANTGFLVAYYVGLTVSTVGVVVPIMQTSPLLVIAVSAVLLRNVETVTPRLLAAAGVIVAGGITVTLAGP